MRIAIMQPYFLPYAGYLRLMCGVEAFVIYDTAQFPRSGWVHRNRLCRIGGGVSWLTLPLARAPLDTPIRNIAFHPHADALWRARMGLFPACYAPREDARHLVEQVSSLRGSVTDYLCGTLRSVADILGLDVPFVLASSLKVEKPKDRIAGLVTICQELGATQYLNAPGGRALYDPHAFSRYGIELQILPEYKGPTTSILQRLHEESATAVRREIETNLY
jgi:WbqC-like protein family